ncbi:MAG: aspartate aminotransferase, partial [Candidatus Eremiobacteraeota bacterium]|nr:aspartate aminotransferase [Candidatus Eremiobacteraeota bacterium]
MLNQRAKNLSPSPTMAIDGRAKQLKADGVDVLNLSVGEPDFDTPE